MNSVTRMSAKGQIVIPKDVRDAMGWPAGTPLEVIRGRTGVTLRVPLDEKGKVSIDESLAKVRAIVNYRGPPSDDADWTASIDEMFRNGDAAA